MNLKGRTIGILEYPHCVALNTWTVRSLQEVWQEAGAKLVFHSDFTGSAPEVDAWFCHLASTRITAQAERFIRSLPNVVNRSLTDIRKSSFSEQVLKAPDASYTGQVIVKSDYNCKGRVDKRLADHRRGLQRFLPRRMRRKLVGLPSSFKTMEHYQVYDSIQEVPPEYFGDDALVVEKFLPEREGELYALRMMFKLGTRALSCRMTSPDAIVKTSNHNSLVEIENDPRVLAWADAHKVDFAKIDYAEVDGEPVFYDINSTPARSGLNEEDRLVAERIGGAILEFMK